MTIRKKFILILLMLFTQTIIAQRKKMDGMHWKIAAELPVAKGLAGAITGVSNQVLIVAGGNNFPEAMPWEGGGKKYYSDVYVYRKGKDSLVRINEKDTLLSPVAYAAVCKSALGIVFAGGENETGISRKAGLLQWDEKAGRVIQQSLPDLPLPLTNAAAVCYKKRIYIAGGETKDAASDRLYMLELTDTTAGWQLLPAIPVAMSHTLAVVQSNGQHDCLYLLGGRKKNSNGISDLYASVFEFDLTKLQWQQKKSLPFALSAEAGLAWGDHRIVICGGDKGTTFHQTEILIAAIANEENAGSKQDLIEQKKQLQSNHPGFSRDVWEYNTINDAWSLIGAIPFASAVTTVACAWGNEMVIAGGEIRAGVRTNNIILGHFNQQQ